MKPSFPVSQLAVASALDCELAYRQGDEWAEQLAGDVRDAIISVIPRGDDDQALLLLKLAKIVATAVEHASYFGTVH